MRSSSPVSVSASRRSRRPLNALLAPSVHPATALVVGLATVVFLISAGLALRAAPIDADLSRTLNSWHIAGAGQATALVYDLFSPVPAIVITIIATGLVWAVSGRIALAIAFAGTVAVTWVPADIIKIAVARPRPDATLLPHPVDHMPVDPSYPSGHVVFVAAVAVTVVVMLKGSRWRPLAIVVGALAVVVMAASVSIIGVHYPTDAVASVLWVLGVFPAARLIWVRTIMPLVPFLRDAPRPAPAPAVSGPQRRGEL
ncbi:phosphatase PAP2 family protein [Microbacterium hominis]|uniref:phosphatase PAP2 family protein n=1 Tax=Microbacterium hominis TaxID=162426 RepID=UPI001964F888|nr:phosphatase PAP2 family protein [Microbacterium hominis]QRY40253.1 phosphatase PAP2 family protein [Microbacterium hominis]